jgi:predicted RNA binding protein YcfA (HicA-like mRNA interferase family)
VVDKRIDKLLNYSIKASELENLLVNLGFENKGGKGSHRTWVKKGCLPILLSPHGKDLKKYQIRKVILALKDAKLIE